MSIKIISKIESDLFNRLARGIGAGMIGQALGVVTRLALPPLFLKAWGVDIYGEWLLISAIVANLALTEIGGSVYVINRLTQEFANKNIPAFRLTLHTGLILFTLLPSIAVGLFIVVIYFLPDLWFQKFHYIDGLLLRITAAVLALQISFSIPQGLILGIYRALGSLPRGAMLANCLSLLQLILMAWALNIQLGPLGIAVLQLLPIPLIAILATWDLNQKWPQLFMFSKWNFDLVTAKSMLHPTLYFFVIQISQALSIQGTVIIAGFAMGSLQVVVFTTIRTLANSIKSILAIVSHAAWPDMTRFEAEGDYARLNTLLAFLLRTNIVATILIAYFLIIFGKWFYQLWLGHLSLYNSTAIILMLVILTIQTTWGVYGNLLMATNRHKQLSRLTVISSILSVLLSYIGAINHGLNGMLVGMLIAEIAPLIAIPLLASHYYSFIDPRGIIKNAAPLLILPLLIYLPETIVIFFPLLVYWWWCIVKTLRQSLLSHSKFK